MLTSTLINLHMQLRSWNENGLSCIPETGIKSMSESDVTMHNAVLALAPS